MSDDAPNPSDAAAAAPPPSDPLTEIRDELRKITQWIARTARATGSNAVTFKQGFDGLRSEIGQILGGILVIDGTTGRIEAFLMPKRLPAGSHEPGQPGREPSDTFDIPGGGQLTIPKRTVGRAVWAWKGAKIAYYVVVALIALAGWLHSFLGHGQLPRLLGH